MKNIRLKIRYKFLLLCIFGISLSGIIYLRSQYVIPILMYHSIDDKSRESKLSVSPESFKRQMEFLRSHNYYIASLDEIVTALRHKKRLPRNLVAITFDDGFKNNYTAVYPILKKLNIPATIFIVVDYAGREGYLNWEEIAEMKKGAVDIGSHSISHRWLPSMNIVEIKKELVNSKRIIEERINDSVKSFSYPFGALNEAVKQVVKEAGYSCAVSTNPARRSSKNDIYALKRIRISRTSDNLFVFWIETSGFYTFIKELRDED